MADPTMNRKTTGLDLTPETQAEIWQNATYQSAFMQLVPQISLPGRGVRVPIITGDPVADWVAEGTVKPKSGVGFFRKDMVPYTIAVILPFSNQFRRDFDALYAQIVAKGPGAIARLEIAGVCGERPSYGEPRRDCRPLPKYGVMSNDVLAMHFNVLKRA